MTSPNAADPKAVRQLEKASRLAEVQRREIVTELMSTVPGRRWLCDRLELCHVFGTSFSVDALQMAFAEGERNVGLQLLNDIMSACPQHYLEMMQERNSRDVGSTSQRPSGPGLVGGDNRPEDGDTADDPDYGYDGLVGAGPKLDGS